MLCDPAVVEICNSCAACLIIVLGTVRFVLLVLFLPLLNLAFVGLLVVQVGEDQVKDFGEPCY